MKLVHPLDEATVAVLGAIDAASTSLMFGYIIVGSARTARTKVGDDCTPCSAAFSTKLSEQSGRAIGTRSAAPRR